MDTQYTTATYWLTCKLYVHYRLATTATPWSKGKFNYEYIVTQPRHRRHGQRVTYNMCTHMIA